MLCSNFKRYVLGRYLAIFFLLFLFAGCHDAENANYSESNSSTINLEKYKQTIQAVNDMLGSIIVEFEKLPITSVDKATVESVEANVNELISAFPKLLDFADTLPDLNAAEGRTYNSFVDRIALIEKSRRLGEIMKAFNDSGDADLLRLNSIVQKNYADVITEREKLRRAVGRQAVGGQAVGVVGGRP